MYIVSSLTDTNFDVSTRIDMLKGCDVFPFLANLQSEIIHTTGLPSSLDTYLHLVLVDTMVRVHVIYSSTSDLKSID